VSDVALTRDDGEERAWRSAVVIIVVSWLVRLAFAARLPLFPDETYYWDWSRHLQGGYFDHPPMIAVLIRAGTALATVFGAEPSPVWVRFFPVLAGAVAMLAAAATARRLACARAGLVAALSFAIMPLAAAGLVLATPDAPLLAFEAIALYAVVRALEATPRSAPSLGWWSLAGVAVGLAFVSKYTSIFFPLSVALAIVLRPSLRVRLREPGPYVACVLAVLVFAPVLVWNARHDWISFRFQLEHGLGKPKGSALNRELEMLGGQLGLVTPILFALAASSVWQALRRPAAALPHPRIPASPHPRGDLYFALAIVALGNWAFFVYSAIHRRVEANWPAPAYIPALVLLASQVVDSPSAALSRWLKRGLVFAAVVVAVLYAYVLSPLQPIPARRDPLARAAGWDVLAMQVDSVRRTLGARVWVGADRYQEVSELAYHLPGRPEVVCVCLAGRHNQYELWPSFTSHAAQGDALVLALDERAEGVVHENVAGLAPHFTRVQRGALAPLLRGGDTVAVRRLWTLEGYIGGWPTRSEP